MSDRTPTLTVPPLTPAEARWVADLDRLFKRMPKRLWLVECADVLLVVDREAGHRTEMHDGRAEKAGIVVATVPNATMKITSVSG